MQQDEVHELLVEIDFLLAEGIDLFSSNTETTIRNVKLLCAAATYLNILLRIEYGGHDGDDRGPDLLEQIVAAPFHQYPDLRGGNL